MHMSFSSGRSPRVSSLEEAVTVCTFTPDLIDINGVFT